MIAPSHAALVRRGSTVPLQMLAGLLLGLLFGLLWPSLSRHLQPIGAAFIQAIQMIVIPLIFSAVTLGVYRMGENARQLGRVAVIALAARAWSKATCRHRWRMLARRKCTRRHSSCYIPSWPGHDGGTKAP